LNETGIVKGKVWGTTMLVFGNMSVEAHYLEIKKGGYCSKHRHPRGKTNLFHVISGKLLLQVWDEDGIKILDTTLIRGGQLTTVGPRLFHRFEAIEDTKCYEIYQITIDPDDIERMDEGGLRSES